MTRQTHSNVITENIEYWIFYRIAAKYHLKYDFRIIKISEKSAKYAHDGFQKGDFDARQVTLHHFLHIKFSCHGECRNVCSGSGGTCPKFVENNPDDVIRDILAFLEKKVGI